MVPSQPCSLLPARRQKPGGHHKTGIPLGRGLYNFPTGRGLNRHAGHLELWYLRLIWQVAKAKSDRPQATGRNRLVKGRAPDGGIPLASLDVVSETRVAETRKVGGQHWFIWVMKNFNWIVMYLKQRVQILSVQFDKLTERIGNRT